MKNIHGLKQRFFKKEIKKLLKKGITLFADLLVSNKKNYKYYVDFLREPAPTLKRKSEFHAEWRQRQIKKRKCETKEQK